jgi:membrane protein implicated in regulation of membrane protease activity
MTGQLMDPEFLRWIWLVAGVVLLGVEMLTTALVALPLAVGAFAAAIAGFLGAGLPLQLLAAAAAASASFAGLRPLARRLDQTGPPSGAGVGRLVHAEGRVLASSVSGGTVKVDGEHWPAVTPDGSPLAPETRVMVLEVRGTRLVVLPMDEPPPLWRPMTDNQ